MGIVVSVHNFLVSGPLLLQPVLGPGWGHRVRVRVWGWIGSTPVPWLTISQESTLLLQSVAVTQPFVNTYNVRV